MNISNLKKFFVGTLLLITGLFLVYDFFSIIYPETITPVYYPIRIYATGQDSLFKVDSTVHRVITNGEDYLDAYFIKVHGSDQLFPCYPYEYESIKPNKTVHILYSKTLKRGIYIRNGRPSLFAIFYNLYWTELLLIIISLIIIGYLLFKSFNVIKANLLFIQLQIIRSKRKTTSHIGIVSAYIDGYIPYFSILVFTYYLAYVLIKGVSSVEKSDEQIFGIYLTTAFIAVIFCPHLALTFVNNYKRSKWKVVVNLRSIIYSILSIIGLIKLINFVSNNDFSKIENMKSFLFLLIESLFGK